MLKRHSQPRHLLKEFHRIAGISLIIKLIDIRKPTSSTTRKIVVFVLSCVYDKRMPLSEPTLGGAGSPQPSPVFYLSIYLEHAIQNNQQNDSQNNPNNTSCPRE